MNIPTSASREIEIVGGGLAGLTLGLALRRAGVPVTLHDAGSYPRHRVCGEFIAGLGPTTIATLGLAPVLADALHHREVAWFSGSVRPRIQLLPEPALGLSRHQLDARLARDFVTLGGRLHTCSRQLDREDRPGRIIATGRTRLGRSPWLGLKIHVHGLPLVRELEMHLGRHAYVGLSAIEGGHVNLCGLFRRGQVRGQGVALLLAQLRAAGLGAVADRLAAARPDPDSFCAVAGLGFDRGVVAREGMRLGDAAATTPPFTGNGMAMAWQSAELALPPVVAYARGEISWTKACAIVGHGQRRRFDARLVAARWVHPFLLQPGRQRVIALLGQARLLPFGPLYSCLH